MTLMIKTKMTTMTKFQNNQMDMKEVKMITKSRMKSDILSKFILLIQKSETDLQNLGHLIGAVLKVIVNILQCYNK